METYRLYEMEELCVKCEVPSKSKVMLLCLFMGIFGAHRFVMGHTNWWLMQLTLGGCGVWVLFDLVGIATGRLKMQDGRALV